MSAGFEIQVEGGQAQCGLTYVLVMRCRVGASERSMCAFASGDLLLDAAANLDLLQGICRKKAGEPELQLLSVNAKEHPTHLDVTSLGEAP